MRLRILLWSVLAVVALLGLEAGVADARYLSYTQAYRAVLLNSIEAKNETKITDDYSIGVGHRLRLGRLEFPVVLKGDEFHEYIPGTYRPGGESTPARFIYFHNYCTWYGVAYWHFQDIYVKRRDLGCETWFDENRTQD